MPNQNPSQGGDPDAQVYDSGDFNIQALIGAGLTSAQAHEYVNMAITNGWSPTELVSFLISQGILGGSATQTPGGGLGYSSGGYSYGGGVSFFEQMKDQYIQTARLYGINTLPDNLIKQLFDNNVSVQELSDRLSAVQRIAEFKPAFQEFLQVLKQRGINAPNLNSDEAILKFMLGRAPKQFYSLWDELNVGTAARFAGVHINQKMVRSIARRLPGVQSEAEMQMSMQELAEKIQTLLPLSKLHKYGLSKRDLVTLQFGGPKQQKIADLARRVLAQEQGFQEDRPATAAGTIGLRQQNTRAPSL